MISTSSSSVLLVLRFETIVSRFTVAAQLLELVTRVILHEERVSEGSRGVPPIRKAPSARRESWQAGSIRVLVRFGKQLIRVGHPTSHQKRRSSQLEVTSLAHLKGHAVLNFSSGPLSQSKSLMGQAAPVPIHVRERCIRVRLTQRLVVHNANGSSARWFS